MRQHLLFRQYAWLLDTISRAGKITFEEINNRWRVTEMSDGLDIPRATFNRHRNNIEEMFGVLIECDRKDGYSYYIGNPEDLSAPTIQQWLTNTLSTTSLLIGCQDLHKRILLEEVPSGYTHLDTILSAMKQNYSLEISYQKFLDSSPKVSICEPYCLKMYHRRWYLLAKNSQNTTSFMRVYALDRMIDCQPKPEAKYTIDPDFDANEYFKDYFGVLTDKTKKAETVILRAYGKQADFLRTLPLHHSQRELPSANETNEYADFEYYIVPTNDFISELISKNAWVEVLQPASLRETMKQEINYLKKIYGL